jgi:hypothetical protein
MNREAPADLFDEIARFVHCLTGPSFLPTWFYFVYFLSDVLMDLKLDAFPRFLKSTFFQKFIR